MGHPTEDTITFGSTGIGGTSISGLLEPVSSMPIVFGSDNTTLVRFDNATWPPYLHSHVVPRDKPASLAQVQDGLVRK